MYHLRVPKNGAEKIKIKLHKEEIERIASLGGKFKLNKVSAVFH